MELIAKDKGGNWCYENGVYYLIGKNKKVLGRLYEADIPDPVKLMVSKCAAAGVEINSKEAKAFKSNAVIYKLWEHKNANTNA